MIEEKRRPIAKGTRRAVLGLYGHRCCVCESTENIEIHHKDPVSKCGKNRHNNLGVLCQRCHSVAHNDGSGKLFFEKHELEQHKKLMDEKDRLALERRELKYYGTWHSSPYRIEKDEQKKKRTDVQTQLENLWQVRDERYEVYRRRFEAKVDYTNLGPKDVQLSLDFN